MAGQLSHAYLFSGQDGVGKKEFTKEFVKFINCQASHKSDGRQIYGTFKNGCNECQSCKFINQETFPDLLVVKSINSDSSVKNEKDMMEIDVAQIRQVNYFLSFKSYYGKYKAVMIENAERMNTEAQNSFLKTLEEPKGDTLIILLSSKPDYLLPTIFSRCQYLTFLPKEKYQASVQDKKMLQELLPIIQGELAQKFGYTKKVNLEGDNADVILKVLQRYFRNLLLIKLGINSDTNLQMTSESTNAYTLEKLKNIIRLIETLHAQISQTNASAKLALEVLLLEI